MTKWTREQEAYLLIKREEGIEYNRIAELMEMKFGIKRNVGTIHQKHRNLKLSGSKKKNKTKTVRQNIVWNEQKVDFIYSALWNGLDLERIKDAFEEQFSYRLSNTQLKNCLAKKKPSGKIQALAERMLNTPNPTFNPLKEAKTVEEVEYDNWRIEPATRKQLRYLASLMNPDADDKELKIYAKGMKGNYTKGEACDKIDQMVQLQTEAIEMINLERPRNVVKLESTVKEETVEEIKPIEFTREQDLYLLINWHSMSIDDAREYFRMPYYLLAKRLELVLDSTEPYHIELLMEATEAINKRKREEDAITNAGFWRRRKLRKRQKKVAKLEKKLKSMRGE